MKPPNIKDVAREANCSIATVSCVLNNRGRIGKATQKRVREICKKMSYFPSSAGRNLRSQKTESIGILFYPSCAHIFNNVFYSDMMMGLELELTKANKNLVLAGYDISTQQEDLPKFIREGYVDGVILMGGCPDAFKQKLSKVNIPFLLLDNDLAESSIDSITSDGFRAMTTMVGHLYDYGHRNLLMVHGDVNNYNENSRCAGFETEARRLNLKNTVIQFENIDEVTDKIMTHINSDDPATAVCCVNDDIAFHIMNKLLAQGIKVPEQMSIVGFDDTRFSQTAQPPITTIRINRKLMGEEGAKAILSRISDPNLPPIKQILSFELITRKSVKLIK